VHPDIRGCLLPVLLLCLCNPFKDLFLRCPRCLFRCESGCKSTHFLPNGKIIGQKTSDFNIVLTFQGQKGGFSGLLRRFSVCFRQGKVREGKDAKGGGGRAYVEKKEAAEAGWHL